MNSLIKKAFILNISAIVVTLISITGLAVRAAPERGRANEELLDILSEALGLPASALEIASGATAQDKRVRVTGIDAVELRRASRAARRVWRAA